MDPKQQKSLLHAVRSSLSTVQELEKSVQNFSGDQELLDSQLNGLIASLKDLQQKQSLCNGTDVPIDILRMALCRALDAGGNPDISTLDLFRQGLQENQATKGKVAALSQLRDSLSREALEAYPEASRSYQALKAAAPAVSAPAQTPGQPKSGSWSKG